MGHSVELSRRCDPGAQFDLRRYVGRHLATVDLIRRARRPLPAGSTVHRRDFKRVSQIGNAGRWLYKGAGVVMIIMGVAIMTGQLSRFAY